MTQKKWHIASLLTLAAAMLAPVGASAIQVYNADSVERVVAIANGGERREVTLAPGAMVFDPGPNAEIQGEAGGAFRARGREVYAVREGKITLQRRDRRGNLP